MNKKRHMIQIQHTTDKKRALDILQKAYCQSQGLGWMIKKCDAKKMRIFISFFMHECMVKNGAWITGDKNGVLFFYHMSNRKKSFRNFFRKMYIIFFITGIKNGVRAMRLKKMIDTIRPKTGWLGFLVATDIDACDKAAAYEIKREMFEMARKTNETIYLETTVPRVRLLYKAAGYKEYYVMKHPYTDLTIWFMKREVHGNL
jgi:hypothetical protein